MSSSSNKRLITMDKAARKIIKMALKIANLILGNVGIAILFYSLSMIITVLRDYRKYFFSSWFMWSSVATGMTFCFTSGMGFMGALTRSKIFLSCHIVSIFLHLLMELLIMADVSLNDDWEKDFPKDPARRFDDFLEFVDHYDSIFKFLALLIFLVQAASFGLAVALRLIGSQSHLENDAKKGSASLPFLAHHVGSQVPYVMGHPFPAAHSNVEKEVKDFFPSGEKDVWVMSTHGCPPPTYL